MRIEILDEVLDDRMTWEDHLVNERACELVEDMLNPVAEDEERYWADLNHHEIVEICNYVDSCSVEHSQRGDNASLHCQQYYSDEYVLVLRESCMIESLLVET